MDETIDIKNFLNDEKMIDNVVYTLDNLLKNNTVVLEVQFEEFKVSINNSKLNLVLKEKQINEITFKYVVFILSKLVNNILNKDDNSNNFDSDFIKENEYLVLRINKIILKSSLKEDLLFKSLSLNPILKKLAYQIVSKRNNEIYYNLQ